MARNIFRKMMERVRKPRRNTFDLSRTNNLTCEFGKLVPVFLQDVIPGDSFEIEPSFALRLAPMQFPIQTQINARMHFFYVRNKNIWDGWEDFIGNQKDLVSPYLSPSPTDSREIFKVGGIADYLGVPVVAHANYSVDVQNAFEGQASGRYQLDESKLGIDVSSNTFTYQLFATTVITAENLTFDDLFSDNLVHVSGENGLVASSSLTSVNFTGLAQSKADFKLRAVKNDTVGSNTENFLFCFDSSGSLCAIIEVNWQTLVGDFNDLDYDGSFSDFTLRGATPSYGLRVNPVGKYKDLTDISEILSVIDKVVDCSRYYNVNATDSKVKNMAFVMDYTYQNTESTEYNNMYQLYNRDLHISSLPFRAYESIYNAFYRDTRNNPLMVDGQPEYNKFNTTLESGADATPYHLFNANWESDYLTTATHTPQQGVAPLIGVTGTGLMSFQDSEGNTLYAQASLGEDGNTIIGLQSYDTSLPDGTLQILQDSISAGISIADVRNVNALQRWLERNLRLGFRYRDLVKAQFGVEIKWSELDMPEFIGGVSKPIIINQISQTTPGQGGLTDSLGSYAGQGGVVGQGRKIRHYCDDYGFIVGIMSVVPVPIYSQMLPKLFLREGVLDYYAPDFGNIGSQPIFVKEVAPLQAALKDVSDGSYDGLINSVFGYQRAWYDYIQAYDQAHGQFLTSLRNFLFHRTFDDIPELGEEFLTVDSRQLNEVFVVTDNTDKIFGELYFKCSAKRPIPLFGIPKLEN